MQRRCTLNLVWGDKEMWNVDMPKGGFKLWGHCRNCISLSSTTIDLVNFWSPNLLTHPTYYLLVMPHSWCKCQSCLLSGPHGCLFSKPDFKIHQLWLEREHDDWQVAAQAAAEQGLFTVAVVDLGSNINNTPSTMWNSWEHVQAQTSFSADNTSTIS